jgi:hypothetical protein
MAAQQAQQQQQEQQQQQALRDSLAARDDGETVSTLL